MNPQAKKDRIPPHDIEIEKSLLASCMLHRDTANDVNTMITPQTFYKTAHGRIFETIQAIVKAGDMPDIQTVYNHLKGRGLDAEVGGASYIAGLIDYPIPMDATQHARMLYEKYALREILNTCYRSEDRCYSNEDPARLIDEIQANINSVVVTPMSKTAIPMDQCVDGAIERAEYLYRHKGELSGITTGIEQLDRLTCGFQPSDLVVLAARPSMGKTAMAIGMPPHPTHWFSLEMSKEQLVNRRLALETGIDLQRFRDGYFSEQDWPNISRYAGKISQYPIHIDDTGGLNYMEIRRRARKVYQQIGTKLIIIDHLQLVQGDKNQSRDREIGSITSGLKNLAKELNIPILLLCQLNRKVEERGPKRPMLSDLRDSGNIEQDADVVIFIYRDEVYNKDEHNPERGKAELIIAKQRNGPTGFVKTAYIPHIAAFKNLEWGNHEVH